MSEQPVIELRDLGLRYRLAQQKVPSFKEYLIHFLRRNLEYKELWAVDGVNLNVGRGEVLGICGRNGAGKSTLLKVISGVFPPTRGERIVRGKISPILELGTGFDPELTGVENVYMNALLRGHRRAEVDKKLDEILDFSGLGDFVHSPVRNYSTGMLARLGFSVATAWVPEVLVLDEVLSVGDARFLIRCHNKIESFREAGTTVLIVSHSPSALLNNCTRVAWIDQGKIVHDGPTAEVIRAYAEFAGDFPTLALLSGEPAATPEPTTAPDPSTDLAPAPKG